MAWLWRIKRRHSVLKIIPQEGTRSVEHVYTWKRYEKASECLAGLIKVSSLPKLLSKDWKK